jgi:hypothetical protein
VIGNAVFRVIEPDDGVAWLRVPEAPLGLSLCQRFNGRQAAVIQFLRPGLAGRLGVAAEFRSIAGGTQVKDFTIGEGHPETVGSINLET